MTWAAVGSTYDSTATTIPLSPAGTGNLILLHCITTDPSVFVSSVSGGNCTWTQIGPAFPDSTNGRYLTVFEGTVTATGAATATFSYNGTPPDTRAVAQEFSTTVGTWNLDIQGTLSSGGTSTMPLLTPTEGAGELYSCFGHDNGSSVAGFTSGYTYYVTSTFNGYCYNTACDGGAQAPAWADSTFGDAVAVLMYEAITYPGFAANVDPPPRPPTWFPRFPGGPAGEAFQPWPLSTTVETPVPGTGPPAITPVTGQANTGSISSTSIPVTLASGVTLGNLLVVGLGTGNPAVTYTGPARWAQAGPTNNANLDCQMFYLVVGAPDAGATSFTFTLSVSHNSAWFIREWNSSTGWVSSPVDVSAGATAAASATISAGTTGATAQVPELAVAALASNQSGDSESGLTGGYTSGLLAVNAGSPVSVREAYQVLSATGTQACQETISTAVNNTGVIAAFKPVPPPGPAPVTAQPLPAPAHGWFPGAPGMPLGVPFLQWPAPADPGGAVAAVTQTGTSAVTGAGSVTAVATQAAIASAAGAGSATAAGVVISPATATGAGAASAVATQVAPGTAAGAGAVTDVATQAVTGAAAGAGATATVVTQAVTATAAGAGSVTANATQAAGAAAAGAGSVTDVVTQIAGASAAGAGSVTAAGSVSGASTAAIAGAGAVTAVVTQIAPAAAAGSGAAVTQAVQGAGAVAAGAGTAGPTLATQIAPAAAAGAGSVADVATQIVIASAAGAGSVTAAGSVTGAGATASIAGAGAVTAVVTQAATGTAPGAGSVTAAAAQAAKATAAGAGSVTAAGQITGTASVAGAAAVSAVVTQAAGAVSAGAGALAALAAQRAVASITGAGAAAAAGGVQLAFTVGALAAGTAPGAALTANGAPSGALTAAAASGTLTARTAAAAGSDAEYQAKYAGTYDAPVSGTLTATSTRTGGPS